MVQRRVRNPLSFARGGVCAGRPHLGVQGCRHAPVVFVVQDEGRERHEKHAQVASSDETVADETQLEQARAPRALVTHPACRFTGVDLRVRLRKGNQPRHQPGHPAGRCPAKHAELWQGSASGHLVARPQPLRGTHQRLHSHPQRAQDREHRRKQLGKRREGHHRAPTSAQAAAARPAAYPWRAAWRGRAPRREPRTGEGLWTRPAFFACGSLSVSV